MISIKCSIRHSQRRDKDDRSQQFRDLTYYSGLLEAEGLVYPEGAWFYMTLAKYYKAEDRLQPDEGAIQQFCGRGQKVLKAFREALRYDVMCTGPDSRETRITLELIRELEL